MTRNPYTNADPVYALAAAPDGVCFAARASGLYCSHDGGERWRSAYGSLNLSEPLSTTALAVSPGYAQDRTLFAGVPGGILRSTDAGQHWSGVLLPDPPPRISALGVSPAYAADHSVFATTLEDGTFYSTDRGETWQTGNFALLDHRVLALAISPDIVRDRMVLIGTETGAFVSRNGGRSWEVADLPYVPVTSVAFAPDGMIYTGADGDGLYQSRDAGHLWSRATLPMTLSVSLILAPAPGNLLVFAAETLYCSRDSGGSWTTHRFGATVTAAALIDGRTLLIGCADGTIRPVDFTD